jgi:hypothetical protein
MLHVPDHLPLLSESETSISRGRDEVVDRTLCLYVTCAVAFGFDPVSAWAWILQERLADQLEPHELCFIRHGTGDRESIRCLFEAINAISWASGFVARLDPFESPPEDLVHRLPNLQIQEDSKGFRSRASLRQSCEVAAELDLLYCLHWRVADDLLTRRQPHREIDPSRIIMRRHALEWLVCRERWSDVPMDT